MPARGDGTHTGRGFFAAQPGHVRADAPLHARRVVRFSHDAEEHARLYGYLHLWWHAYREVAEKRCQFCYEITRTPLDTPMTK